MAEQRPPVLRDELYEVLLDLHRVGVLRQAKAGAEKSKPEAKPETKAESKPASDKPSSSAAKAKKPKAKT